MRALCALRKRPITPLTPEAPELQERIALSETLDLQTVEKELSLAEVQHRYHDLLLNCQQDLHHNVLRAKLCLLSY